MSKSGLITGGLIPPRDMAKVRITPLESLDDADEFFFFTVDFYACQQSELF